MIKVLLFANLREKVGQDVLEIEGVGWTIKKLRDQGFIEYELEELSNVMVAVNEEYRPDDYILQSGDIVAMIPPVSGG